MLSIVIGQENGRTHMTNMLSQVDFTLFAFISLAIYSGMLMYCPEKVDLFIIKFSVGFMTGFAIFDELITIYYLIR